MTIQALDIQNPNITKIVVIKKIIIKKFKMILSINKMDNNNYFKKTKK